MPESVRDRAIFGVNLADEPVPPQELPAETGLSYFRLQKDRETTLLWERIADELRVLLGDPELRAHTESWPDTKKGDGPPSNLLFYEDPDYGFVLNVLVKSPGAVTNVHDHGKSWTLYGVLEGGEHIERYRRTDDNPVDTGPATLDHDGSFDVTPG